MAREADTWGPTRYALPPAAARRDMEPAAPADINNKDALIAQLQAQLAAKTTEPSKPPRGRPSIW